MILLQIFNFTHREGTFLSLKKEGGREEGDSAIPFLTPLSICMKVIGVAEKKPSSSVFKTNHGGCCCRIRSWKNAFFPTAHHPFYVVFLGGYNRQVLWMNAFYGTILMTVFKENPQPQAHWNAPLLLTLTQWGGAWEEAPFPLPLCFPQRDKLQSSWSRGKRTLWVLCPVCSAQTERSKAARGWRSLELLGSGESNRSAEGRSDEAARWQLMAVGKLQTGQS